MRNEYLEHIKSALSQAQVQEIFQACEFAVIQGDESEVYFLSDSDSVKIARQFTVGHLWDLASVSKVLGVGTVLIDKILAKEIDLDATLQSYYPAWQDETVSIRQLMTHTSGIDPFIKGRDQLDAAGLTEAMNHLKVNSDKSFKYTDVNFVLLGFMLEKMYGQSLDQIFQKEVFERWEMTETSFGPVSGAVPTVKNRPAGIVHDPKAQVLGVHCGSAGLFSSLADLTKFVQGYFANPAYLQLLKDFTKFGNKPRSLAWDLLPGDFLLHTGYTGTFILMNLYRKSAIVFLSNRVYYRDERQKWLEARDLLISGFMTLLSIN